MGDVSTPNAQLTRGAWCNLCGSRLSSQLAPRPFARDARNGPSEQHTWSICEQCYEKRLRCSACGGVVGTQAYMLEGDLRFYCRDCFEIRPRCDTCDRPVGAYYWSRHDGRSLCDRCQSTAVTDANTTYALYRHVRAALAQQPGISLREPCHLKLVSRHQLLALVDKSSLHSLDADSRGRCFGLFMRQGAQKAIFIEYGLPRIVLLEVIAHELAHAWQSENCEHSTAAEVQEGFAEWVAYRLLHSWGCSRRSDRMLRREDLYGRGLKLVLGWETQGGTAEVFRRIMNYEL